MFGNFRLCHGAQRRSNNIWDSRKGPCLGTLVDSSTGTILVSRRYTRTTCGSQTLDPFQGVAFITVPKIYRDRYYSKLRAVPR